MDTSRPPHGERTRKAILDAIVAMGDLTEKHYLEVKSERNIAAAILASDGGWSAL
ncbi:hypothetical protein PJ267_16800 [Arthrobacter sp. OVS8]|nr:hypothetical protein PJ267_16800 [Arthrobacter sp. OVS8]